MHIPERMCIACRKMAPKGELIKVVSKDGKVETDRTGKLPGRGAYFCKDIKCIEKAQKKKALSKHFKTKVSDSVYEDVKELLNE